MKISVSKVLNIALLSLLVTVLFFGVATSDSGDGYDPWVDYDRDGQIDYTDLYRFAVAYGTSGDPRGFINAPAYDSGWTTITQGASITLTHDIESTDVLVEMLGKDGSGNIHKRNYGGNQPPHTITPEGFINPPAYDSGWVDCPSTPGGGTFTLTHDLGTTEVFVYVLGKSPIGRIHQGNYGGYEYWRAIVDDFKSEGLEIRDITENEIDLYRYWDDSFWTQARVMIWRIKELPMQYTQQVGAYWDNLSDSTIDVFRAPDDEDWTQVRVMIWRILEPLPNP